MSRFWDMDFRPVEVSRFWDMFPDRLRSRQPLQWRFSTDTRRGRSRTGWLCVTDTASYAVRAVAVDQAVSERSERSLVRCR